eukprot:7334361-Karenia_brevis.AAC.1
MMTMMMMMMMMMVVVVVVEEYGGVPEGALTEDEIQSKTLPELVALAKEGKLPDDRGKSWKWYSLLDQLPQYIQDGYNNVL